MLCDFRLGAWWVRLSQNTIQCDGKTIRLEPKVHQWSLLTKQPSRDFTWSHVSDYLYVERGEEGICRIRVRDGKEEKVAETHGFQAAAGDFGIWLGLTPDDTPLLLRNLSSDRIYALEWGAP